MTNTPSSQLSKFQACLDEQSMYTYALPEDSEISIAMRRFFAEEEAKKLDEATVSCSLDTQTRRL
jgi:hypothetical protein